MASCNNPEHAALESELNDALEEALQMEERLAAYEMAGAAGIDETGGGGLGAAAKAAEEIAALQEQVGILEKERDAREQDYLTQKDRVNEVETQLEDKEQKVKDLVSVKAVLVLDFGARGCRIINIIIRYNGAAAQYRPDSPFEFTCPIAQTGGPG